MMALGVTEEVAAGMRDSVDFVEGVREIGDPQLTHATTVRQLVKAAGTGDQDGRSPLRRAGVSFTRVVFAGDGAARRLRPSMNALRPAVSSAQSEMESSRLYALDQTRLLQTPDEAAFDELVMLAAEVCGTPISAFTLLTSDRQWIKAAVGLSVRETSRDVSFCQHAILQDDVFVIEDARQDDRFRNIQLVTADPNIRFYAGMPLSGWSGAHFGTLCVLDTVPRQLRPSQYAALKILARQVEAQIEIRVQQRKLEQALQEREAVLADLRSSEDRFRTFMDNAPFLGFIKDEEGRFVFYNDRMAREFGIGRADWIGKNVHDLFPEELADVYRANDLEAIASGCLVARVEETTDAEGRTAQWKSHKFPWLAGGKPMLGCISVDLTSEMKQQRALEALCGELELLAATDGLTGLANRRVLDQRVKLEFQSARRYRTALSVVLIDIDNFKRRNDQFGHAAGDQVLQKVGSLIRSSARETDLAARYGGEEFVIVLPNTDGEGALQFAERLKTAIDRESWPHGPVTASIGIASLDAWTPSGERLIALADDAMYEVKCTGKNRILSHRELLERTKEQISPPSTLLLAECQGRTGLPAQA